MSQARMVGRNVIVTLISQVISWAMTFAVTIYLPRYLGAEGLGKFSVAGSIVAIFGVLVPLGTSMVLVKEIARDRSRTADLLSAAIVMRVPLGILMTFCAVIAGYLFHLDAVTRLLVTVISLGMILGTVNDALGSAIQGQENLPRQSVTVLIEKFLNSGLTIALVLFKQPLWTFAAVSILTGLASLCVNLEAFKSLLPSLRWPSFSNMRHLAVAGMPFMGWTVFAALYGQTDPIIIRQICGNATVGWYALAYRIFGTTLFLSTAIVFAVLPTLARLYTQDIENFRGLARRTLGLVMLFAIPIAAVLVFQPKNLIALMHYPGSFVHTVPLLQIGGVSILLWYATSYVARLTIACDVQGPMVRISMIATVIAIPACIVGTYITNRLWANGATGALISDTLVELYLLVSYLRLLPSGTFGRESVILMARSVLASVPMVALFAFLSHLGMGLWGIIPCTIVYVIMCWLLGCLTPRDIAVLRSLVVRKANAMSPPSVEPSVSPTDAEAIISPMAVEQQQEETLTEHEMH